MKSNGSMRIFDAQRCKKVIKPFLAFVKAILLAFFKRELVQIRCGGGFYTFSLVKTPILGRFHQRKVTVPCASSMRKGVNPREKGGA
jgi:hypothetical protein